MAGLLSSHRRRRRLAWLGGVAAVGGALAAVAVIWPNTGRNAQLPQHEGVKAVYVAPESVAFDAARARAVLRLEQSFVEHAVFRRDVGKAYDLVTSDLRGGLSRADWADGTIPVEPFPGAAVKEIRGRLLYSYADRVSMQIRFVPKEGSGLGEQTFDLVMRRVAATGGAGADTWQVSSWLPSGFGSSPRTRSTSDGIDLRPKAGGHGQIAAAWLALPAGVLGVGILLVLFLAGRGWHRQRRALRDYHATRAGRA